MPLRSVFPHGVTRPVLIAALGSVSAAFLLLHQVERPDVVWLLPMAWLWGAAVMTGLRAPSSGHAAWLVAIAFAVRVPLVGAPPLLSDDLYRYIWEGLAWASGHDVFASPPATISGLDDALRAKVNHPEVPSVYPPLALWWFRMISFVRSPWFVQLATALADATIPASLAAAGADRRAAWTYALHPLAVLESACGAHIDVPALALATGGIALWRADRRGAALVLTVAAALTKVAPVLWLPTLLRGWPARQLAAWSVALALGIAVVSIPVLPSSWPEGWLAYGTRWEFNGFAYPWLAPWLGGLGARRLLMGIGAAVAVRAWIRHRDPVNVWADVGVAFVLLAPTLHPWYVLWALVPNLLLGRWAWGWASLALLNGYAVLAGYDPATGAWAEAPWLWWITWVPALLALGWARVLPGSR